MVMLEKLSQRPDLKSEYWNNVAVDHQFLHPLYNIFKPRMTFIDLGCGVGNVLLFAQNIGYNVTGVELDNELIPYISEFNHIHSNILDLAPELYKNYDVIYAYMPLKSGFEEYLNLIIDQMNQGSFLITPLMHVKNPKIKRIFTFTYIKI